MKRLSSGENVLGLLVSPGMTAHFLIEKRAVEMPSYAQPMYANRRVHSQRTGLGKLAKQGCIGILKVAAGEFTTVPQPRLRFGKEKKKKGYLSKKRMSLDPNGPVGVA